MNIRQEVEKLLIAFANSYGTKLPIAFEGVSFTPPQKGNWLEVVFLEPEVTNPTVDVISIRKWGVIQINCRIPDNLGVGPLEVLCESVAELFPVYNKQAFETFTVEQTPKISNSWPDDKFRCAAVGSNIDKSLRFNNKYSGYAV